MSDVTLVRILVHTLAETNRHAGHADIVRELVDGQAGFAGSGDLVTDRGRAGWERHRERLERVARDA